MIINEGNRSSTPLYLKSKKKKQKQKTKKAKQTNKQTDREF
jgi:hypothetical protein